MSATTRAPVVRVAGLNKSFGDHHVLFDLDLDLYPGEFVALLGRSGGGKSTFLRVLEGLETDYSGKVLVPDDRSVVFQEPRLLPWKRVWQNVAIGLPEGARTAARSTARDTLREVGLEAHTDEWPLTLSGGEAQRVGLARALITEPELVLFDEPFAALDALTRSRMHDLLRRLLEIHGPGAILVTHDVSEALALADRVLVLDGGRFVLDLDIRGLRGDADHGAAHTDARDRILAALGGTEFRPEADHADGARTS